MSYKAETHGQYFSITVCQMSVPETLIFGNEVPVMTELLAVCQIPCS